LQGFCLFLAFTGFFVFKKEVFMNISDNILEEDAFEMLEIIKDKDLDFNINENILFDLDNFSLDVSEIY